MRFVPVKSQPKSDIQSLHRARERLVRGRTALINHLRALLLERGITAPQSWRKFADLLGSLETWNSERSLETAVSIRTELRGSPSWPGCDPETEYVDAN